MNTAVDSYFSKADKWSRELAALRKIALGCGLQETLKWGTPCYTLDQRNIVLIHAFKEYCAFLFFKGALLKDTDGILIQQSENVQSARQVRFTNPAEIKMLATVLTSYIYQAMEVEKAGLKVDLKKVTDYPVPEEFEAALKKNKALKTAFQCLTPGRQRAYLLYFAAPRQSATRESRISKSLPQILAGKGLND